MSKKTSTPARKTVKAKAAKVTQATIAAVSTPVRYTALPKLSVPAAKTEVTAEQIATKAYELYTSGRGSGELDNWLAAEAELRLAA